MTTNNKFPEIYKPL